MSKFKTPAIKEDFAEIVDNVAININAEAQKNQESLEDNKEESANTDEPDNTDEPGNTDDPSLLGIEDEAVFNKNELNPSNWNIVVLPDSDLMEFNNSATGRIFKGTMDQFNNMLRISNFVEN